MTEIWKDVVGFEGFYEVSSLGRIKSLRGKGRIMKLETGKLGYVRIHLSKEGLKNKKFLVHRLVAEAFLGLIDGKPHVNHINSIRGDNRLVNLEWCTPSENLTHASVQGRLPSVKGSKNAMATLTETQVLEIRKMAATKQYKQVEIGMIFGIDEKHVSLIVLRKRWKHI